jgi:hypothetical protein
MAGGTLWRGELGVNENGVTRAEDGHGEAPGTSTGKRRGWGDDAGAEDGQLEDAPLAA